AFALAGCGRDDVKVYHVAKDDSAAPPNQIATSEQNSTTQPQLQWTLPSGWQEIAPNQMRVASFTVTGANGETADVGVIPLPTGGDELALVNMWRDQMQLPALTNETSTETISVGKDSAKLFDIASDALLIDGKFRARILVAMLTRGETSWFFKMTGEDSFVVAQKENFLQFLKSVSFVENAPVLTTTSPMPGTSLGTQNFLVPSANQTVIGGTNSNSRSNSIWTIPADWQQLPASEFLVAKFSIAGADGASAQVNVSSLAGEGGGVLANVNRWLGQLGLGPLKNEMELAHLPPSMDLPGGGHLTIVDFTGTDSKTGKPARLVGAIVPQGGQTWFYKLMGDEQVVAQQKDAFIEFIQSAKYPDAGNAP
ncbi:MAG TPA: hypothetical protein VK769_05490, partial [Verrucomicrobiae bacterium]|nr:hypothetical protein [Verrucomicrobiae bacterium]